jgi:hypothetical protein
MAEPEIAAAKKKVTTRSPSFPYIPLQEAIERSQQIYDAVRAHPARSEAVASHWGYSAKSSGARQTVAALRQFGFVEGEGAVKLTQRALKILFSEEPERSALVKEAALAPQSHVLLWRRYGPNLPNEKNLRMYLVLEEGFNENSVADFLKEYRATISYAKLGESDILPPTDEGDEEASPGGTMQHDRGSIERMSPPPPLGSPTGLPASGFKQDVFTLSEGDVVLRWPEGLSKESFPDLQDWLEVIQRKIARAVGAELKQEKK